MEWAMELTWLELVVLVLASFRLTRLIVYDEITAFLRDPFFTVTYEDDGTGRVVRHVHLKGTGLRQWLGTLLSCHWCVGIWSSALVVALHWLVPATFPLLCVLAVAGAAAFLETKLYLDG
ncbi:MAG: DUF1360 domain-containing protein [Bacillota bacterium]